MRSLAATDIQKNADSARYGRAYHRGGRSLPGSATTGETGDCIAERRRARHPVMAGVGDFHECCGDTTRLECRHVVAREHRHGVGVFAARQRDNLDIGGNRIHKGVRRAAAGPWAAAPHPSPLAYVARTGSEDRRTDKSGVPAEDDGAYGGAPGMTDKYDAFGAMVGFQFGNGT